MNPQLRELVEEELRSSARFPDVLDHLAQIEPHQKALWELLKAKEEESRSTFYERAMEMWHRSQGWNMAKWLLWMSVPAAVAFLATGGEVAFESALLFFCGAASYYVVVQILTHMRAQRNRRQLEELRRRYQERLQAILEDLRRGAS